MVIGRLNAKEKYSMSLVKDAGLPLSSRIAWVVSSAETSSIKSRLWNLSLQCNEERGGGIVGENSSGKVKRFSFWAIQVRRLAFARLRSVRRCSFFFAAHHTL